MLRSRRKSNVVPKRQRLIFIVRTIDPLWLLESGQGKEKYLTGPEQDSLIYLTNNVGLQTPPGRVYLVHNNEHEGCPLTQTAIREKLVGYEVLECRESILPPTKRTKIQSWLRDLEKVMDDYNQPDGTIIVVVDPAVFSAWEEQVSRKQEPDGHRSCVLMSEGDKPIISVA